jgi:catechol 2,3-dioxygenase-like lactoylglutathione lyase family enzyme
MSVSVSTMFIPVHDADEALGFYRDALGLEVRNDVAKGELTEPRGVVGNRV